MRGPGVTVYATILGSPDRSTRNGDLVELMQLGALALPRRLGRSRRARLRAVPRRRTGAGSSRSSLPRSLRRAVLVGRPLVERVVAPVGVELPVRKGQKLGEVRVYDRGRLRRALAARRLALDRRSPARSTAQAGTSGATAHNMWGWVLDDHHRHAQRRSRSHADRAELPARPAAPGKRRRPDARRAARASTSPAR